MGVGYKNRGKEACEGTSPQRQKGAVVKDAPTVCPPPMRAKEQKRRSKKSLEKQRSNRIESLTRPTASSRAKERSKPLPRSESASRSRREASPNKKAQKSGSRKSLETSMEELTPVERDEKSALKWEVVHGLSESPYVDALAECDSDVYFFDNYDLNPLLVDVEDVSYDSFSDDALSSTVSCHSALSTCISFDYCEKRERWSQLLRFTHGFACAVSFAAGLSLGMAIGACSLLQSRQPS